MKNEFKILPEIEAAKIQDARDRIHNEAVDIEIDLLNDQIQQLNLKRKGSALFTEKRKVISPQSVYSFIQKPTKFLLSRMNRNTKLLNKGYDMSVLNEQILITSALTYKVMKNSSVLHEIETFTDRDLLLERSSLLL